MTIDASDAREWAQTEFGRADLGDIRRTARLVMVAASACERPHGRVATVFGDPKQREGAYDLLENDEVAPEEMMAAVAEATAARATGLPFVFVPVDGTSLALVDRARTKDFGIIGTQQFGARGLKVIDALGVDPNGVVLGWLGLTFWARPPDRKLPPQGTHARRARPVEEKETRFWLETIHAASSVLDLNDLRAWYQVDREGDNPDILLNLARSGHWWTVRNAHDRSIELQTGDTSRLRPELAQQPQQGTYDLEVVGKPKRKARTARIVVRTANVTLRLRDRLTSRITLQEVTAVWAHEETTTPEGEDPIDWLLFTNYPVSTFEDARLVVFGYAQRWRVEECHRTWKSGGCNVEETQLRSFKAVQRWAIVLASVAARIERLKRLARTKPSEPATIELTQLELDALVILRFGALQPQTPTIAEAVLWLADLGGYCSSNKYAGKPPGATTIGRGLLHLRPAAKMLEIMRTRQV